LDRRHHRSLIGFECRADSSVIIDVSGHRIQYGWEGHQRYKRWIEALLLCRVGPCGSGQIDVLFHPIISIDYLLRITGGRANLREQRVGVKCDWRKQLV
jgi:hypothetical protein